MGDLPFLRKRNISPKQGSFGRVQVLQSLDGENLTLGLKIKLVGKQLLCTVDERNPAPPGMYKTLLILG